MIQRLEALPGTNDDLEGTYGFVKEMSGKIYNHLVKNCSDEAFGIVRSVESGDGVEAWAKLHQKYSQCTMSRMMRVLMECMYPKEVKGSELVQAILQWEMKWNLMKDQPGGTNIPELWRMAALMKMCPKEIKHNIELRLGHDRREVLRDEGEGCHVGHKCSGKRRRSGAHGRGHRGRRRMRRR